MHSCRLESELVLNHPAQRKQRLIVSNISRWASFRTAKTTEYMQRLDVFANQSICEAHPHNYGEAWKLIERHSREARNRRPLRRLQNALHREGGTTMVGRVRCRRSSHQFTGQCSLEALSVLTIHLSKVSPTSITVSYCVPPNLRFVAFILFPRWKSQQPSSHLVPSS